MKSRAPEGRRMLLLLSLLCLAPVLAAWVLFRGAVAQAGPRVGELLPTRRFAAASLSGWPQGGWSLVEVISGPCAATCQRREWVLRQIRLAQGEQTEHLTRIRLQSGAAAHGPAGLLVLQAPQLARRLAAPGYFLIDPLGNQVMFYRDSDDPGAVIAEIARLMQINNAL